MRAACIAARNEEATIGALVEKLVADKWHVIVINDGSTDDTAWNALTAGAHVIHQYPSRGIGPSLQLAWQQALKVGADVIVQLDAGGSHDPEKAKDLAQLIEYGLADMVVGSRFCIGGHYVGRKWRALCSLLASALLNFASHGKFSDWTSGYLAFSRETLTYLVGLNYQQTMHAWQIEVLGRAQERNYQIVETPITYAAGKSSMRLGGVMDAIMEWLWLFNR